MSVLLRIVSTYLIATFAIQVFAATSPTTQYPYTCNQYLCRFLPGNPPAIPAINSWSHWDKIENFIVFGASYAATGPDILDPTPPYKTSCNGPNYIDFLSNGFNQSVIKTKNYAIPGSSVSPQFAKQVVNYTEDSKAGLFPGLSATNSLYHAEFGINDITGEGSDYATLEPAIFVNYTNLLETLYQSGARNYLIIDVPPIDRSPDKLSYDSITSWNAALTTMLTTLSNRYTDATFFRMGMHGLFDEVLDNVSVSNYTAGYKDTTTDCKAYTSPYGPNNGTLPSETYKSPDCPYSVNEYFWLQGPHPTYPMHDLVASEIAAGLESL